MKRIPVISIRAVRERSIPYSEVPECRSPGDAAEFLREWIGEEDREHFVVLCLNTKHRINAVHTVSIGSLNASLAHPREVFKAAIATNASTIIVAHNHPSGEATPSPEDVAVTQRLVMAGKILGIEVLDSLIVTGSDEYVSLRSRGLVDFCA